MGRLVIVFLLCLGSGCSGDGSTHAAQTERLVDPFAFGLAQPDPFADQRGAATQCSAEQVGPDSEVGQVWYTIETGPCGHGTVSQPLLFDVPEGAQLDLVQFHFVLTEGLGFELRLAVGDPVEILYQESVSGPSGTGFIRHRLTAPRALKAGEPVYWSVTNDGANAWSLVDLTASW